MKRTHRGFAIYTEFQDTYGAWIRVQKSSAATTRRCWIFANEDEDGGGKETAAHLSPQQARRVAKALHRFADGQE